MKKEDVAVWCGSVVLLATAAFHATGYTSVVAAATAANLSGMIGNAIGGLWLFVSLHWLFIAVLAVVVIRVKSRLTGVVLALSALVLIADTAILLAYVGPFIGEALLAISASGYAAGAAWRSAST